ncbi:MAG: hypothetical protein IKK06_08100, partial [Clostridia bacterium]|nr:hypothetical protein [Clostridia bacterium]
KKQNRKGSPQSLIYPLKGKLTSFVTKQFFHFEKGTSDSYEIPPAAVFAAQLRFDCKNFDVRGDDCNT